MIHWILGLIAGALLGWFIGRGLMARQVKQELMRISMVLNRSTEKLQEARDLLGDRYKYRDVDINASDEEVESSRKHNKRVWDARVSRAMMERP